MISKRLVLSYNKKKCHLTARGLRRLGNTSALVSNIISIIGYSIKERFHKEEFFLQTTVSPAHYIITFYFTV